MDSDLTSRPDQNHNNREQFIEKPSTSPSLEKAVQDFAALQEGRFIPESVRWQRVKELNNAFSAALDEISRAENPLQEAEIKLKDLSGKIEKSEVVEAMGDINLQGLRYILSLLEKKIKQTKEMPDEEKNKEFMKFITEFRNICKSALDNEEYSSEPVREQIFQNICKALSIPPYPLERLDKLYSDFQDTQKRQGLDMGEEMNRDIKDEIEHQPGIRVFIEQQNTFWDTKRIQFVRKSENEKEVVGREWDFWKTMTQRKFLIRQSRMQSLKKLVDGEISFEDMKKENEKYIDIKSWKMN